MRLSLAAVLLAVVTLAGCRKSPPPNDGVAAEPAALGVGDPAPAIIGAVWLKGGPVPKFEPGKVYVVEFWATWCGPCLQSMPHLGALADKYKDAGLRVVMVTTADDQGNDREAVTELIAKRGAAYDFAWAFCPTPDTDAAWMQAANQSGIPCSFVVGKDGNLAFIGHPSELDEVLPRIVAGTWRGAADLQRMDQAEDELRALRGKVEAAGKAAEGGGPAAALAAARTAAGGVLAELPAFEAKYPEKAALAEYRQQKLTFLLQAGQYDAAKAAADPLLASAAGDPRPLSDLIVLFTSKDLNPDRKHIGLATAAADALLKASGEDDLTAVVRAAQAYSAAGDKPKADGYAAAARRLAAGKASLAKQVDEALADFQK